MPISASDIPRYWIGSVRALCEQRCIPLIERAAGTMAAETQGHTAIKVVALAAGGAHAVAAS